EGERNSTVKKPPPRGPCKTIPPEALRVVAFPPQLLIVASSLPITIQITPHTMAINYLILLSRQGKVRLAKWFTTLSPKEKAKIIKDVTQLVLSRRTRMCNFLEYKDSKVVYRRYASLFFIAGCASTDNELISLEIVHRYVEQMDKYYGNVCELDIIFNFQKAYFILDELLLAGEMQESSKKNVLRCISQQDSLEDMEVEEDVVTKIM
ncbi:AP-1 complex subunit sigma, partial [Aspergillus alliaceus]